MYTMNLLFAFLTSLLPNCIHDGDVCATLLPDTSFFAMSDICPFLLTEKHFRFSAR